MHLPRLLPLLFALTTLLAPTTVADTLRHERETFADLGLVDIVLPATPPSDLVLLLDGGHAQQLAEQLATEGRLVARMPLSNLLANAQTHKDRCLYPVTLLDVFSQHLQQKYRFADYRKPALVGAGDGAAVVYATLAQAAAPLFRVGVGIDFCPAIAMPVPPCAGEGNLKFDVVAAARYRLLPTDFATSWHTLNTQPACPSATEFGPTAVAPDLLRQLNAILNTAPAAGIDQVSDLPLIELSPHSAGDYFVVLISGDGGWANIDKDIGNRLNQQGIPVVGWNSLQYFWTRKTPERASADLARAIRHYQAIWHRQKVVLVGFSLGADVLPFMISRLPSSERAAIADVSLLSLGHRVDFEFHVTDWLGSSHHDSRDIAPELARLHEPVLCIYGTQDSDTLCPSYRAPNVTTIALPGDHHFEGDFERVSQLILEHVSHQAR